MAGNDQDLADIIRHQNFVYPDYEQKDDFGLWLMGFEQKIRSALGLSQAQEAELKEEVLLSISGKLMPGPTLDAYLGLSDEVKGNYDQLIRKLTEEFLDPQKKQGFLNDMAYNKRKKNQALKDFKQEVDRDMAKYSDMPEYIEVGDDKILNDAQVREGIRRFCAGIRDRKGRKDKEFKRHLKFHLHKAEELTWDNVLDVAGRWETANYLDSGESSLSSDEGDHNEVQALELKSKAKSTLASLSEKVEKNSVDIQEIKAGQENLSATIANWKKEIDGALNEILTHVQMDQLDVNDEQNLHNQEIQQVNSLQHGAVRPKTYFWKGSFGGQ